MEALGSRLASLAGLGAWPIVRISQRAFARVCKLPELAGYASPRSRVDFARPELPHCAYDKPVESACCGNASPLPFR